MKNLIKTKSFSSILKKRENNLKSIIKTSSNRISAPLYRKMTHDEINEFVNNQPEWVQWIWDLNGFEDRMIRDR